MSIARFVSSTVPGAGILTTFIFTLDTDNIGDQVIRITKVYLSTCRIWTAAATRNPDSVVVSIGNGTQPGINLVGPLRGAGTSFTNQLSVLLSPAGASWVPVDVIVTADVSFIVNVFGTTAALENVDTDVSLEYEVISRSKDLAKVLQQVTGDEFDLGSPYG